jgi:hypothetical protein
MADSPLPFGIGRSLLRLDSRDPYMSLHFIMIFVRDQERSLRFYRDQVLRFTPGKQQDDITLIVAKICEDRVAA